MDTAVLLGAGLDLDLGPSSALVLDIRYRYGLVAVDRSYPDAPTRAVLVGLALERRF